MKVLIYIAILFLTFGVTVARETLQRFGLDDNLLLTGLMALALAGLLVWRNVVLVVVVALSAVALNLPGGTAAGFSLDRDLALALLIAVALLPVCYRWVSSRG